MLAADMQGKLAMFGMFDLSAAFDCVDHDFFLNPHALEISRAFFLGHNMHMAYSCTD